MSAKGHEVIHYGHEKSEVVCHEHVTVTNDVDLALAYGDLNWKKEHFRFDPEDHAYKTFNANCISEIGLRKKPNDFLLCFFGWWQKPIAEAHSDMRIVEPGIGYVGELFAKYKVFESQWYYGAWYGQKAIASCNHYSWYDAVIPNYFDFKDFEYCESKDDYFLHLGRVGKNKGLHIAIEATEAIGAKLKVAGQGSLKDLGYTRTPDHVEILGYADVDMRKRLMAKAKGLFILSQYGEPFGGTQVEAMISGTPVISTDWGCFGEINLHGITGYRCRTMEHITWAAKNIHKIKPADCRKWAENFSTEKVSSMYEEYFDGISNIYGKKGWYEPNEERTNLDWLKRTYPNHD